MKNSYILPSLLALALGNTNAMEGLSEDLYGNQRKQLLSQIEDIDMSLVDQRIDVRPSNIPFNDGSNFADAHGGGGGGGVGFRMRL